MNLRTLVAACLIALPGTTLASTVTFDTTDLLGSTVNPGLTEAVATDSGLTLTVTATNGGVVDLYSNIGPNGIAIGAAANGLVNSDVSGTTNPTSGDYTFAFDSAVSSISLSLGFVSGVASPVETLSNFAVDGLALPSGSISASGLVGTTFTVDPAGDVLSGNGGTGNGFATLSFSGGSFSSFSFSHAQAPSNLGFIVTNVSVDVAPVPLPASGLLILAGLGGLAAVKRRARAA